MKLLLPYYFYGIDNFKENNWFYLLGFRDGIETCIQLILPKILVSQQQNISTASPNIRMKRDVSDKKTVFSKGEEVDFLKNCGNFFLGKKMPIGIDSSTQTRYICQKYNKNLCFATHFNAEKKTADYSAYMPHIGPLKRPAWSDLYEHGKLESEWFCFLLLLVAS